MLCLQLDDIEERIEYMEDSKWIKKILTDVKLLVFYTCRASILRAVSTDAALFLP